MSFNKELTRATVLEQVLAERESQDLKWGDQTFKSDDHWTVILTEELGEVAREVYEKNEASWRRPVPGMGTNDS